MSHLHSVLAHLLSGRGVAPFIHVIAHTVFLSAALCELVQAVNDEHEQTVLYCTSGILWNLSQHPRNRDLLYVMELEVRGNTVKDAF